MRLAVRPAPKCLVCKADARRRPMGTPSADKAVVGGSYEREALRCLRLTKRRKGDKDKIKAFGQGQLCRFLTTARDAAPDAFAAFAVRIRVAESPPTARPSSASRR